MKLFIDDIRNPPDNTWTVARTSQIARAFLACGNVTEVSFDNDLGLDSYHEGWQIANWLHFEIRDGNIPAPKKLSVHSANPVAAERIQATLNDIKTFLNR